MAVPVRRTGGEMSPGIFMRHIDIAFDFTNLHKDKGEFIMNELTNAFFSNLSTIISPVNAITGGLIAAIFLRRNTETTEFEKLKAKKFEEVIDDLLKAGKMSYTEFYKAKNFLKIAEKADIFCSQNDVSSQPLNLTYDWLIRFYEDSGMVSDDDIQILWAKILAGKINNPSKYSLLTLNTLKNIGKSEAELFDKILAQSFNKGGKFLLPNDEKYLNDRNIYYDDIIRLSELNLINNASNLMLDITVEKSSALFYNHDLIIKMNIVDHCPVHLKINAYAFSIAGSDIALARDIYPSNENMKWLAQRLNSNNKYTISLHRLVSINGDDILCDEANLLDFNE